MSNTMEPPYRQAPADYFSATAGGTSNLRLNIQLKDNPSKRISIIAKNNCKIQQLKRRIERQFTELHQQQFIVALIEDSNGFSLSNNSSIGEHVRSGDFLFVTAETVDLNRRMHLGSDLQDNFLSLRYVCNSFCEKLLKMDLPTDLELGDALPEFMHLGFWYVNPDVVVNVARVISKLLTQDAVSDYYKSEDNAVQKGLLLALMGFWVTEIERNLNNTKELLKEFVSIISKLCFSTNFVMSLKTHSLLKAIVNLSKNEKLDVMHQKALLKIVNTVAKGNGAQIRPATNHASDYIPSFIKGNQLDSARTQYNPNDIEGTLAMLGSQSPQIRKLGLSIIEKDVRQIVSQATVRSQYFDKLVNGLLQPTFSRDCVRSWTTCMSELTKRLTVERSRDQLTNNLFSKVNSFLLACHPSLHPAVFSFIQAIGSKADYIGDAMQAVQWISSPYKILSELAVKVVMTASEPQTGGLLQKPLSRYMRQIMAIIEDREVEMPVRRNCMKIVSNVLLSDDCRYEVLNNNGLEMFAKRIDDYEDVEAQRIAAKALLNIAISSRENKLKVMTLISHMFELMYKNKLDRVVEGYLQTILKAKETGKYY